MLKTIARKIFRALRISEIHDCYIILALGNKELSVPFLAKEIKKVSLGDCYPLAERLYPKLDKLKKEGLISSREGAIKMKERGGRVRTYYKLTEQGTKLFELYKEKFFDIN